jgi:hypothetical protein
MATPPTPYVDHGSWSEAEVTLLRSVIRAHELQDLNLDFTKIVINMNG